MAEISNDLLRMIRNHISKLKDGTPDDGYHDLINKHLDFLIKEGAEMCWDCKKRVGKYQYHIARVCGICYDTRDGNK